MFKVWHPNDQNSAHWLIAGLGINAALETIPGPGSPEFLNLPEHLKRILRLDKPDLILTIDVGSIAVPIVSIELTTTTPQSQHAKQRVPRVVAAAEADIPAIYVIPGRKLSKGSMYRLGPDLYLGLKKIRNINDVPIFIYEWPDTGGHLQFDAHFPNQPPLSAPAIVAALHVISELISLKLSGSERHTVFSNPFIAAELAKQDAIAATATNMVVGNYGTLQKISTANLSAFLSSNTQMNATRINQTVGALPQRIVSRDMTLVFKPAGRLFEHANDPYSGMLAFFDYAFCRIGRGVEDRHMNLVYMPVNQAISKITDEFGPDGYHAYWRDKCAFRKDGVPAVKAQFNISHHLQYGCVFAKNKPMRILGYFSDLIIFQDSVLVF